MAHDALAKREVSITTERARITLATLEAEKETRAALAGFVGEMMKKGTDYGEIPGTDKPTLLKPGAEKLVDLFRCTPKFSLVKAHCKEDFSKGFFKYTFRVQLLQRDSGAVVAEGFGSANSHESRYRWRQGKRKCPACNSDAALNKSKDKPEFYCWAKKGGCGAIFGDKDARIVGQVVGRVPNEDIADLDNTILKMAKKRALVDGAIALARCSDMFTQDVEDLMDMAASFEPAAPPSVPLADAKERATKAVDTAVYGEQGAPKPGASSWLVAFGPHKGTRIDALRDEHLIESVDLANRKLTEQPSARWAKSMRENLALLNVEVLARKLTWSKEPVHLDASNYDNEPPLEPGSNG